MEPTRKALAWIPELRKDMMLTFQEVQVEEVGGEVHVDAEEVEAAIEASL